MTCNRWASCTQLRPSHKDNYIYNIIHFKNICITYTLVKFTSLTLQLLVTPHKHFLCQNQACEAYKQGICLPPRYNFCPCWFHKKFAADGMVPCTVPSARESQVNSSILHTLVKSINCIQHELLTKDKKKKTLKKAAIYSS